MIRLLLHIYSLLWLSFVLPFYGYHTFILKSGNYWFEFYTLIPILAYLIVLVIKGEITLWTLRAKRVVLSICILLSTTTYWLLANGWMSKPGDNLNGNKSVNIESTSSSTSNFNRQDARDAILYACSLANNFDYCKCKVLWIDQNLTDQDFAKMFKELGTAESDWSEEVIGQMHESCLPYRNIDPNRTEL